MHFVVKTICCVNKIGLRCRVKHWHEMVLIESTVLYSTVRNTPTKEANKNDNINRVDVKSIIR